MTDGPDPDAPPPRRPGPVVIEMDDADAIGPEAAPPVPEPDAPPGSEAAMARAIVAAGAPRARGSGWRFLGWAAGATLGFVLTVGAAQFVATLLAVHPLLGWWSRRANGRRCCASAASTRCATAPPRRRPAAIWRRRARWWTTCGGFTRAATTCGGGWRGWTAARPRCWTPMR
jgi:hypothetical protein